MENVSTEDKADRYGATLKITVALLAVLSIGQLASVFVPTYVGSSPQSFAIIGSVVWPALFMLAVFSLKGKNKLAR